MAKVLIATEKPFASNVRDRMVAELQKGGLEVAVLEGYTTKQQLIDVLPGVDYLIFRNDEIDEAVIDAGSFVYGVRAGTGLEKAKVAYAKEKGKTIEATVGANAISVGELAIGMMLIHARNLTNPSPSFNGMELHGKSIGYH